MFPSCFQGQITHLQPNYKIRLLIMPIHIYRQMPSIWGRLRKNLSKDVNNIGTEKHACIQLHDPRSTPQEQIEPGHHLSKPSKHLRWGSDYHCLTVIQRVKMEPTAQDLCRVLAIIYMNRRGKYLQFVYCSAYIFCTNVWSCHTEWWHCLNKNRNTWSSPLWHECEKICWK